MKIRVGVSFNVHAVGNVPDGDLLAAQLGDVMDALLDLRVMDPDVSSTLSSGHVDVSVIVEATDELGAIEKGVAAIRTGISAADGLIASSLPEEHATVTTEKLEFTSA